MKNNKLFKLAKCALLGTLLMTTTTSAMAYEPVEPNANYNVKYGVKGQERLNKLNKLIEKHQNSPLKTKLKVVNDFFNDFFYLSDDKLWGQNDYWATPIEFLGVGMGDCEDYAIAKFDALTRMGVNKDNLRLIYVTANIDTPHMVLGYYANEGSRPLILDNMSTKVVPATLRTDLLQIYAFNKKGIWVVNKGTSKFAGNASRLSQWNEVNTRTAMRLPIVDFTVI
ncbi:transglutaminase-like cysteine peptidase [Photobacterium leiognathi]|uniref:transglutaminase-like cysteine peptidase n=1 Tax=Photobacterium leiognathi TaxID=553611 RepID=UPI002980DD6D|nr:transglutaminase-like cysteine peptidase [Photobacterium leiognathi]